MIYRLLFIAFLIDLVVTAAAMAFGIGYLSGFYL